LKSDLFVLIFFYHLPKNSYPKREGSLTQGKKDARVPPEIRGLASRELSQKQIIISQLNM
jgi:hypothetical protein